VSGGYVCSYAAAPAITFPSSTDVTNPDLGLSCSRLETPLPGFSNFSQWSTFWKLAKLIESI
jgi:hypothetical protein